MSIFKFNYISYDKILESVKWRDMIDAIDQPTDENLLVTGLPWCWKSTIATHRLDKFRDKKWWLLTYWKLLTSYIKQWLEKEDSKEKVFWFWKWFYAYRRKYWLAFKNIKDITWEDIKETFELIKDNQWKYDFLLIDEWQDLPKDLYQHLWIIANHLSVFADDAQQLYSNNNANVENIINGIDPVHYELNINRRNPKVLYEFALSLNPKNAEKWNLKLMTNKSDSVEIYKCNNDKHELNQILSLLDEHEWKNIAILFSKSEWVEKFGYELKSKNIDFSIYHKDVDDYLILNLNSPILTTFHSSKWLEFDIVIIPWIYPDIRNNQINENHFFVAFTRASEKLIITHHNGNSEIEERIKNINKDLYEEYNLWDERENIEDTEQIPF